MVARKIEAAATSDETTTIAEIHQRILAKGNPDSPAGMKAYTDTIPGTKITFDMVPIPGGTFMMGSPDSEAGHKPDEGPQHKVKISPFWMEKCEVTWNEYELFMYPEEKKQRRRRDQRSLADAVTHPTKPYVEMSFGMGKDGFPAISMTQHAANTYCKWLSAKTGHFYRLPTEAEWEYACRAGTTTAYFFGDDVTQTRRIRLVRGQQRFANIKKSGKKKPNPWGLYDMYGNVAEWTLDQYDPGLITNFPPAGVVDPWNKATKPYPQSVRGGSWQDDPDMLPQRRPPRFGPLLENAGPAIAQEHLVSHRRAIPRLSHHSPAQSAVGRRTLKYWNSGVEKEIKSFAQIQTSIRINHNQRIL